jgi:hypothetical protein
MHGTYWSASCNGTMESSKKEVLEKEVEITMELDLRDGKFHEVEVTSL